MRGPTAKNYKVIIANMRQMIAIIEDKIAKLEEEELNERNRTHERD